MLRAANPAEIVRCNQKDESYLMFIKRSLGDIAQSVFGPRSWLKWRKELDLAADLLYFGLTTYAGFQTLGEEYVNVIQVDPTQRKIPSRYIRVRRDLDAVDTARSNYRLLGWLSMIQLTLTFIQHVYRHLKTTSPEESLYLLSGLQAPEKKALAGTEEGSGMVDASRKCSLCLETRKRSTATPCGHLFCWECITEWCSNKAECPLCREKFTTSRLIFLQNFDPF